MSGRARSPALPSRRGLHASDERDDKPAPRLDRLVGTLRYAVRWMFIPDFRDPRRVAKAVHARARNAGAQSTTAEPGQLSYRLRRDGLTDERIVEGLAAYCSALEGAGLGSPPGDAIAAAVVLVQGGVTEVSTGAHQVEALAAAAALHALCGFPVHVLTSSELSAVRVAERLGELLAPLALRVCAVTAKQGRAERTAAYACNVTCGALREVAQDYLRDRLRLGAKRSGGGALVERIAGTGAGEAPITRGLHCALVADADLVMLDDALVPVAIAGEADVSQERVLYEQALELARALERESHYTVATDRVMLTAAGESRLARLAHALGGAWNARQRRDELVVAALAALHVCMNDRHYRVTDAGVEWPQALPEGDASAPGAMLVRKLTEVKEGCKLSARRDLLARLPVSKFLRRYLHLAGVCGDVTKVSGELYSLYSLRARGVGERRARLPGLCSVYADSEARNHALLAAAADAQRERSAIVVAVRSADLADALIEKLAAAGLEPIRLGPGSNPAARAHAKAALDRPGAVVLALHPVARELESRPAAQVPVRLVIAELHEGRHSDAYLALAFGARTCTALLALDDAVMLRHLGALAARVFAVLAGRRRTLGPRLSSAVARLSRSRLEAEQSMLREEAMSRDQYLADLLAFSGGRE